MRLSIRVVLCLLALSSVAGLGCRKALTPNIDRNEAPETWITAAPLDTLTILDKDKRPVGDPTKPAAPTTIPVRFHMYWAGSDKDGTVTGFYWAVVETTTAQTDGAVSLPGPKPGQYSFTTKTDTTFVFTVSELFPDRLHAFFIYAVDNQGKPDPTPARFLFNATDKFPPRPIMGPEDAWATGKTVTLSFAGEPVLVPGAPKFITDTMAVNTLPTDTVPAYSRLDFRWRGEITQPGTSVKGYRYQLDETKMQEADAATTTVSYGTGLPGSADVAPGLKIFTLKAIDQSGGAGTTKRRFIMNYVPETWWAGPDPSLFPVSTDGEYRSRSVDVLTWPIGESPVFITNPPLPAGSTFGPDSLRYRPSKRFPPNRSNFRPATFYEIYKDRLYARTEGDTVHMNSIVVLWNGGYDPDSRYLPRVTRDSVGPTDPQLRHSDNTVVTGPVVEPDGVIGSPIGFRSQIVNRLTPMGLRSVPAQTSIYPNYEPASVYRAPRIGGYWRLFQAGKAYAVARAEDADGGLDNSVREPVQLADAVDNGGGTPEEQRARREVLVFYVDKAPALVRTGFPQFLPTEGQSITTAQWDFKLRGMDLDPYDPGDPNPPKGGPTNTTVIRFKIMLYGHSVVKPDSAISWTYFERPGMPYILRGTDVDVSFIPGGSMAANPFASGPIRVSIQICDCIDCEGAPGQGRCVDGIDPLTGEIPDRPGYTVQNVITVNYTRPASPSSLGTTSSTTDRPGSELSGQERLR
jgi:hypothetical protein